MSDASFVGRLAYIVLSIRLSVGGFMIACSCVCLAQGPQKVNRELSDPPTDTKALTEDLLDLLVQPPPAKEIPPNDSANASASRKPSSSEETASNPLQEVKVRMQAAADLLDSGTTDKRTLQLQADIVKRLDDLIDKIAQQSPSPNQSQLDQANQQSSREQGRQPTSPNQRQQSASQKSASSATKNKEGQNQRDLDQGAALQPDGPQSGDLRNTSNRASQVQLNDPRAMQMKVWGQLPERVRQQMQSRVVEQFLPSHREQIEAYYRELAK